ncbi:hypothetical protein HMPREF0063_10035 [Aeromicrobium marinum DSM 15272]|uniref:Uncharacterized protein n=1 Tax=Aeromicrobium marinum DSM 15272 TaxID=585531 RepID=E2S7M8_9ACTN|nr:hypothetical protein HMPREF0063_10035 [Aeromicrobium marinum DSM 15272]
MIRHTPPGALRRRALGSGIVVELPEQSNSTPVIMTIPPTAYLLEDRLERALAASDTDWRTVDSLAGELGVSAAATREAIRRMGSKVRRPARTKKSEEDWYRLSSRGLTWQERLRILLAFASRTS